MVNIKLELRKTKPVEIKTGDFFKNPENNDDVYILLEETMGKYKAVNLNGFSNWNGSTTTMTDAIDGLEPLGNCEIIVRQL